MRTLQIVALVGAGCVVTACSHAQGTEAPPARPVKAQRVTIAPPAGGVRYSASIEPFEQITLAFKASGYVDEVLRRPGADGRSRAAQAGDFVAKGTVLARVHEADYRQRLEQGRAQLTEGQAAVTKARLDLDRARTLYAAESLTKPDLDAAQATFDTTQARVVAAQADIELAASALRDCALVSPASGILLERRIEVGSLVGTGAAGFVFGDVSSVKARFGIPDAVIARVKLGDPIDVIVESLDSTAFRGRVTAIAPTADPHSRVFDVEVTVRNGDGRLRPGMIGTVEIASATDAREAASPALTLPLGAVVRSPANPNEYAVLLVERQGDAEIARLRRVVLGDVIGNGVAVVSGVANGDHVVTTGAALLNDGDRIRVIP
ncbi:MAG TPA: efflux RND transporter periplasmic adaptor subunit [Vicinamibacterales bacterium]|nr:efflux RND transporter periplasmic adaptor subunit [Vicinamibacterales bacterium]